MVAWKRQKSSGWDTKQMRGPNSAATPVQRYTLLSCSRFSVVLLRLVVQGAKRAVFKV